METIFEQMMTTDSEGTILLTSFLINLAVSLAIGLFLAFIYTYKSHYTRSFVMTLAMLPAVVASIIMMVSGSIGAGIAVAGAFSLVRFRSAPGTAKEIGTLFLSMGAGLICGMGYIGFAVLFTVIMGTVLLLFTLTGQNASGDRNRILQITIPEDLDYTNLFEDLMEAYTTRHDLIHVKTTNMGSLFKLKYSITLDDTQKEKEFIDHLRCRNGNLEVGCMKEGNKNDSL